jgi:ankyrin repeat protein
MFSSVISLSAQPEPENHQSLVCLPTLMQAAISGNIGLVKAILRLGVEVSSRADDGSTALHCAARADEVEVAHFLLQAGAQIEVRNAKNRTPLHEAVMGSSLAIFTLLMQHGANVTEGVLCGIIETGQIELFHHTLTYPGNTLIESLGSYMFDTTVKAEQATIMAILLSIPEINQGWITKRAGSAIYRVILGGQTTMLKLMLTSNKLDPNMRIGNMRLLHIAASKGHRDIVHLLLQNNTVDVNNRGWSEGLTPLQTAAAKGHTNVVEQLLQHPDLVISPTTGKKAEKSSLLHFPCRRGHVDVVALLLRTFDERGISVDYADPIRERLTPLAMAIYYGHANVAKLFLQRQDIDFNTTNKHGRTLLQLAAEKADAEILGMLLSHDKVDFTLQGNSRRSLLIEAACNSNWPTAGALLKYDEQAGCSNNKSPIQEPEDELDIMRRLLLDKDFPANAANGRGESLWHQAARNGNLSLAMLLLEHSKSQRHLGSPPIDINLSPEMGETPLQIAVDRLDQNMLKLILLHRDVDINMPYKKDWWKNNQTALTHILEGHRNKSSDKEGYTYIVNLLLAHGAKCTSGKEEYLRVFLQSQQPDNEPSPPAMPGASIVGLESPNIAIASERPASHRALVDPSWAAIVGLNIPDSAPSSEPSANGRALANLSCAATAGHGDAYLESRNFGADYGNMFDDQMEDYDLAMGAMMAEYGDFMNDHDLEMDNMMDGWT